MFWAAITVALTALDWPLGFLSPFWKEFSFTSGIVTGLLLLGFGLGVVEVWFRAREARKWTQISYIAVKELGYVTSVLVSGLDYLLTLHHWDGDGINLSEEHHQKLKRIVESNLPDDPEISPEKRLRILLTCKEWTTLAVVILDNLKHQHRRDLAIWVPVILTTDKMTHLINQSAQANQAIFILQDIFRTVIDPRDARFAPRYIQAIAQDPAALQEKAIEHWKETHSMIVQLQQKCMQAAELTGWENPHRAFS